MNSTSVMDRLSGKVAIVTASTHGIGFAIAQRLAAEGAKVVISSRQEANVKEAVEKLKQSGHQNISGVVCHVAKPEDRKRLYEEVCRPVRLFMGEYLHTDQLINIFPQALNKFGGIDILISNAAVNPHIGLTADCPEDKWDKIFDVNVKSAFLLIKEVLPHFKKRGGGSIVTISSMAGLKPFPEMGAYSVSKTALISLTRTFANELAPLNIRVNCIAPGMIRTTFSHKFFENKPYRDNLLSQVPMGRTGETNDVDGVAAFLCSNDAKYITGETIVVAGGLHTRI